MPLQGFVDVCDGETVAGWAWDSDAVTEPVYVDIHDNEVLLARVLARGYRQDLRDSNIGDGHHAFEFRIPATFRDCREHRISVRVSSDTDKAYELAGSPGRVSWYPSHRRPEAVPILRSFSRHYPWSLRRLDLEPGRITIGGWLLAREPIEGISLTLNGMPFDEVQLSDGGSENPFWYRDDGRYLGFTASSAVDPGTLFANNRARVEYADAASGKPLYEYHTFYLDPELWGKPLLPDAEGIRRVTGQDRGDLFLLGGYTTYVKLKNALREITGLHFASAGTILDWGCGCGRLVRYLLKDGISNTHGADVDPINTEWCRSNLPAQFTLLPLRPPSPFPSGKFDLVLGVSVFTHLDEDTQWLWLEELQRICSCGAILMLTFHGEASVARGDFSLEWLNHWIAHGFDSSRTDGALDAVISDRAYYRVTFHTTEYIKTKWSKYFEVLGLRECFMSNYQDLVILRKR